MICNKCGIQNNNGEKFCNNCGCLLPIESQNLNVNMQNNMQNNNFNENYINQATNPNMKKWAILSIIVPIVGIIWYCFIGLTSYTAIFISLAGCGFAVKSMRSNKTLSIIGEILNLILCILAIIMFFI